MEKDWVQGQAELQSKTLSWRETEVDRRDTEEIFQGEGGKEEEREEEKEEEGGNFL